MAGAIRVSLLERPKQISSMRGNEIVEHGLCIVEPLGTRDVLVEEIAGRAAARRMFQTAHGREGVYKGTDA